MAGGQVDGSQGSEETDVLTVTRAGVRLDKFLADATPYGRRAARDLIRHGRVLVDGRRGAASVRLSVGQVVEIDRGSDAAESGERGDDVGHRAELEILVETQEYVAVAKPAGMHSVAGRSGNSVADALRTRYPEFASAGDSPTDGGLVHRLDRDTSGVLLAARSRPTWIEMRAAFSEHHLTKHYLALVSGELRAAVEVDQALARRRASVRRPRPGERSFEAATSFHPLEVSRHWSLVLASMRTGVTHQIRAHAAIAGFPIIGDMKYGSVASPPGCRDGHLLHALRLCIPEVLDVTAPVPEDFRTALERLRRE